jgi:hypothetical protein
MMNECAAGSSCSSCMLPCRRGGDRIKLSVSFVLDCAEELKVDGDGCDSGVPSWRI